MSDKTPEQQFADALAAFQSEVPAIRKGNTATVRSDKGNYSYDYADLTDITEAALPLLAKQGLSFIATPTVTDHGFVLRYALLHVAGHRESGDFPLPDPSKYGAQQIGSWLTYSRRYALCAVTGIAPGGDDDDGERAKDARAAEPLPRAPRKRGATTRHNGPDDPTTHVDEWTVATDTAWTADFRSRLAAVQSVEDARAMWQEAAAVQREGRLTSDDAELIKSEVAERVEALKEAS